MGDLFFVLRIMFITVVVVALMQIRVGSSTIEQKSMAWIQGSQIAENLRMVASGAVKVGANGLNWMWSQVAGEEKPVEKKRPTQKFMGLEIKRSEAYHKQKAARPSEPNVVGDDYGYDEFD